MSDENSQLCERVKGVEVEVKSLKDCVDEIKNNHLAHINANISKIFDKIDELVKRTGSKPSWAVAIILTMLTSLVVGLMILILKQ
ncbi:hypothetical protein HZB93_02085 [Candidatus Falkowbacteria bacterium]|nr:hypothetical protein [Candidatus Falkowbacteria bacterium]